MTATPIYFNIKDLFFFYDVESIKNEYSCTICKEIIYQKNVVQCRNGDWMCEECAKNKIIPGECLICNISICSMDDLSRSKFVEQTFNNKYVKCPYIYKNVYKDKSNLQIDDKNGCEKQIKIRDLQKHQESCEHRFINCSNQNNGCDEVFRFNRLLDHLENQCKFKFSIQCEHCDMKLNSQNEYNQHIDSECIVLIKQKQKEQEQKQPEQEEILEKDKDKIIMLENGGHQHNQNIAIDSSIIPTNILKELNDCKKQLDESNRRCNEILDRFSSKNSNHYVNKWVISSFSNVKNTKIETCTPEIKYFPKYRFEVYVEINNDCLGIYLRENSCNDVLVEYTFTILNKKNSKNNISKTFKDKFINGNEGYGWGYREFAALSDIMAKDSGYLKDDKLTIEFSIGLIQTPFFTDLK